MSPIPRPTKKDVLLFGSDIPDGNCTNQIRCGVLGKGTPLFLMSKGGLENNCLGKQGSGSISTWSLGSTKYSARTPVIFARRGIGFTENSTVSQDVDQLAR